LKIDLQNGYSNDLVVIRVNGKEVFRKNGVTTKLLLGVADSIQLEVSDMLAKVDVDIPSKDLSETMSLRLSAPTYLGISVIGGQIAYMINKEPFAYF